MSDLRAAREPSLAIALIPVVVLVLLLTLNVKVFDSASNQVPLILATCVAGGLARFYLKRTWADLEEGIFKAISMALQATLILMVVGLLIAAWIQAGVVPLMVVTGLKMISPEIFLVTAFLVCCVISLATGSSWTTAGTVGVALMGVGTTLDISAGMVGGAVVSGAYFGDKMSPLSDTTNLAPAMAGAGLIEHIRHMIWTVTPATLITLVIFWFMGEHHDVDAAALDRIRGVTSLLETSFTMSPWLWLAPGVVLVLIIARMPALPSLLAGTFTAVVLGLILDPQSTETAASDHWVDQLRANGWVSGLGTYFAVLYDGFSLDLLSAVPAGDEFSARRQAAETVQELFNGKGGMSGMMGTVALIFCALSFGGVMERSGMLKAIADSILKLVRGTGSLIAATLFTCLGINILASDQYMAIVVPGRMYRTAFLTRRLHPKNLSRCLEDSGTVTSALIPWNTCGAQMSKVLGVATGAYLPFAFLNLLCPVISLIYGFTGLSITKLSEEDAAERLSQGK